MTISFRYLRFNSVQEICTDTFFSIITRLVGTIVFALAWLSYETAVKCSFIYFLESQFRLQWVVNTSLSHWILLLRIFQPVVIQSPQKVSSGDSQDFRFFPSGYQEFSVVCQWGWYFRIFFSLGTISTPVNKQGVYFVT